MIQQYLSYVIISYIDETNERACISRLITCSLIIKIKNLRCFIILTVNAQLDRAKTTPSRRYLRKIQTRLLVIFYN